MRRVCALFYILAALSVAVTLISLVFGVEWVEALTGYRPDGGDGSLETMLVVVPPVAAVLLGASSYLLGREIPAV